MAILVGADLFWTLVPPFRIALAGLSLVILPSKPSTQCLEHSEPQCAHTHTHTLSSELLLDDDRM